MSDPQRPSDLISRADRVRPCSSIRLPVMVSIFGLSLALSNHPLPANQGSADQMRPLQEYLLDANREGRLEAIYLLNDHLRPFEITVDVVGGTVYLNGFVDSEIDRDLAGEIASSIEGIESVDNRLRIAPREVELARTADRFRADRDLIQVILDLTLTARVRAQLMLNESIDASMIDVDCHHGTVRLFGLVRSEKERQLVEWLTGNVDGVEAVKNLLQLDPILHSDSGS